MSLREQKEKSAKRFWEIHKDTLGYAYGKYASFERGEGFPDASELKPLAMALGVAPELLYLEWASISVDDSAFEGLLSSLKLRFNRKSEQEPRIDSVSIPPAEFENTWVLSISDRDIIERNFNLFSLLVSLELCHPAEMEFATLGFESEQDCRRYLESTCPTWLENNRIKLTSKGLRLALPHFYLPKTEEWLTLRTRIVADFVGHTLPMLKPDNLKSGIIHRTMTSRLLNEYEVRSYIDSLKALEREFAQTGRRRHEAPGVKPYSILMLLAPRRKWAAQ